MCIPQLNVIESLRPSPGTDVIRERFLHFRIVCQRSAINRERGGDQSLSYKRITDQERRQHAAHLVLLFGDKIAGPITKHFLDTGFPRGQMKWGSQRMSQDVLVPLRTFVILKKINLASRLRRDN